MAAPTTGQGKQPVPQANSDDDGSYSYTYTSSHSTPRGAPQPTTVAPTTATTIPPAPSTTVAVKTPASTPNKKGDASSPPSAMRSASRPRDGTVVPQATAQQGQPRVVVNLPVHVTGQPEPEFQPGVPAQGPPPPGTTVGASRQLYGNLPRSQAPASTATKGPPQPQRKGASTYLCGCIPVPQFCNFSLDCCGSPSNIRTPGRQRLVLYLFLPFTFFNLLLLILSTALSQLDVAGGGCYTFWGYKENCDTTSYTYRVAILPCTSMKSKLMIGAGLSIISIVLSTIMVGFAWLLCHRLRAVLRKLEKTSKKKETINA